MSDPMIAWQRLRAGNERFFVPARGHRSGPADDRPAAVVFRCADSALPGEMVFGQTAGSLIDVSTWGHAIDTGVVGSIEYAVEELGAPLIVVLGHHGCPAMRAALRAWDEATLPDGATRTAIEQTFSSIVRRGSDASSVDDVTAAHITDTGMALLERSPVIARRVEAGRCGIVCATTSPTDGRIRTYAAVGSVGESADTLLECV